MSLNAVKIDALDNVAVAIEAISANEMATYKLDNELISIKALNDITIYHKLASRDIKKDEPIVKYGEHIGIAKVDIKQGEHVHTHNVLSHREDL